MFLKQTLIVLIVGTFASAIAVAIEDYDIDTLKNMLRGQIECPDRYTEDMRTCNGNYINGLKSCESNANVLMSDLDKKSLQTHKDLLERTDSECQNVLACDKSVGNKFYACFGNQSGKSAATLSTLSFASSQKRGEYLKEKSDIKSNETACNNNALQQLSAETDAAMVKLRLCMITVPTLPSVVTKKPEQSEGPAASSENEIL